MLDVKLDEYSIALVLEDSIIGSAKFKALQTQDLVVKSYKPCEAEGS